MTGDQVVLHARDADSVRELPVRAIRAVTIRRGWWSTLLSHFLTIEYEDRGRTGTETLMLPRTRAEHAALAIADAAGAGNELRFEVEPIVTLRLIAGIVLSGLFVFALGTLRTYFKYDASFVDSMKGVAAIAALIMIAVSMIAFWQ